MVLKYAWLNIWRNKRRTLITMASVFFAVLLAIIMRSATEGVYERMIHNMVSFSSGYIQIHKNGFWKEQSLDNAFKENAILFSAVKNTDGVAEIVPRIECFALASSRNKTKAALVIGIKPESEDRVNKISGRVKKGAFFSAADQNAAIIGSGLALQSGLTTGDSIVLIGQGYHGSSAAGIFKIQGIINMGSPQLNNNIVYLPLKTAQKFYGMDSMITSLSVMINEQSGLEKTLASIKTKIDKNNFEVMTWKEMMPEITQFIEADSSGNYIYISILYMIISFGMFGTLLMMTIERTHEFGILIGIGMRKRILAKVIILESILISMISSFAGIIAGGITIKILNHYPIEFTGQLREVYMNYGFEPVLSFLFDKNLFIQQGVIVMVIAILISIYPAWKILRLKVVNALNT